MEPEFITATEWEWVATSVQAMFWFALLAVAGALGLLTAHAAIPSLVMTRQLEPRARLLRYGVYAASVGSLVIALYALSVALRFAFAVINHVFPRWWI